MNVAIYILCLLCLLTACNRPEAPTGVTQADVEGVWVGALSNTTLLGRSLSGDADWLFDRRTFEIQFLNPPSGQVQRLSGDWKFASGKLVLTLRSSFPITGDIGATDSLFVSILDNQMSLQTASGSNLLLRKIRGFVHFLQHNWPLA